MTVTTRNFIHKLKDKGYTYQSFLKLDINEQRKFYCSRVRRSLNRLEQNINKFNPIHRIYKNALKKSEYKIQKREFIILPEHVGKNFLVYNGKSYTKVKIINSMIGHMIGMFVMCKKYPNHNKAKKAKKSKS